MASANKMTSVEARVNLRVSSLTNKTPRALQPSKFIWERKKSSPSLAVADIRTLPNQCAISIVAIARILYRKHSVEI